MVALSVNSTSSKSHFVVPSKVLIFGACACILPQACHLYSSVSCSCPDHTVRLSDTHLKKGFIARDHSAGFGFRRVCILPQAYHTAVPLCPVHKDILRIYIYVRVYCVFNPGGTCLRFLEQRAQTWRTWCDTRARSGTSRAGSWRTSSSKRGTTSGWRPWPCRYVTIAAAIVQIVDIGCDCGAVRCFPLVMPGDGEGREMFLLWELLSPSYTHVFLFGASSVEPAAAAAADAYVGMLSGMHRLPCLRVRDNKTTPVNIFLSSFGC